MSSWYTLPSIEFYAGRYFTHQGVEYIPGQKLPSGTGQKFPNLEGAVRSRYLIPIAEDRHQIPRHMWGEVDAFEVVLRKHQERANRLNLPGLDSQSPDPAPAAPTTPEVFDPADHTIQEVLDHLDAHPDETQRVYDAEKNGKSRSTLLAELEDRLTEPEVDF